MPDSRNVLEQIEGSKRHIEARLSDLDVERLVRGAAGRRERKRAQRSLGVGLGLGAVAAMAALVLFFRLFPQQAPTALQTAPSASSRIESGFGIPQVGQTQDVIVLAEASRAIRLDPGTQLAVEEDGPRRVELRLGRGRARFEVTERAERTFAVRAGKVVVKVVGTVFDVEVVADRVGVSVEKGAVDVDWGVGQERLTAGERGWFPPLVLSDRSENVPLDAVPRASNGAGRGALPPQPSAAQRAAEPDARELFAEVDAARARNDPGRAAELLKQILRQHSGDPRAPLAAFTLGRMLLNDLGRPREAAAAFHEVSKLAPASQFAEDALAREVEAWTRASEPARARARATLYLERYPAGRHVQRVKALVGSQ